MGRNRISYLFRVAALPLAMLTVLLRLILAEQSSPDPRMFKEVPPPNGLLDQEKLYLDWVNEYVPWLVRCARNHLIRYRAVMYAAAIAGLAITPAIAVDAPTWVPAAFGFITAVGQFVLISGQDQKLYLLCHEQAVRIQRARRDFSFDIDEPGDAWRARRRYQEFRRAVETIKDDYGTQIFRIRGQEPPRPHADPPPNR